MARNLYDLGDAQPDGAHGWMDEQPEKRGLVLPQQWVLIALALSAACLAFFHTLMPLAHSIAAEPAPASSIEQINVDFALCDDPKGAACVLSADSYAYRGTLYHLADIRAPSLAHPFCPREEEMARRSRLALRAMMNGGAFQAARDATDAHPGARILTRDGVSLGQLMIFKGHARPWSNKPMNWCAPGAK